MILSSLLADLFLPSPDPGFGAAQGAGAVLGAVTLLLATEPGRRFLLRDLPVILANTLVLLLILEAGALLALKFLARRSDAEPRGARPRSAEENLFTPPPAAFYPFVRLRHVPDYSGSGVNTDSLGFRITPGADCSSTAVTVNMYGGSTVYGWSLPDSLTIPALLQEELRAAAGRPVNVANRGSIAHNSTQSMIEFLLALQAGDIPDAAVFYEGCNDAATAWYEGDPGSVIGNRRAAGIFTAGAAEQHGSWRPALLVLAGLIVGPGSKAPVLSPDENHLGRSADQRELAEETIRVFRSNCRQIRVLAGVFDLPVTIVWQPALAGERRPLQPEEVSIRAGMDREEVMFQETVWALAEEASGDGGYSWLGDAAEYADRAVYMDFCHMNAQGHRLVARKLAEVIALPGTER
jgi:lysophospholipase L1-like esterase